MGKSIIVDSYDLVQAVSHRYYTQVFRTVWIDKIPINTELGTFMDPQLKQDVIALIGKKKEAIANQYSNEYDCVFLVKIVDGSIYFYRIDKKTDGCNGSCDIVADCNDCWLPQWFNGEI